MQKNKEHMEEVKKLIRGFAKAHLDDEELEICERIADKLARKRTLDITGIQPNTLAAAIVWSCILANPPERIRDRIPQETVADFFGVKKRTVSTRASQISKLLKIDMFNPEFTTKRVRKAIPKFYMTREGFLIPFWEDEEEST